MKLDLNDLFTFTGLISLTAGVSYQFTPAIAAIVSGSILFILGVWRA